MKPVRLQLSRRRGFDLQKLSRETNGLPAVKVTRPSDLGNPFVVGEHGTRQQCVYWHALLLHGLLNITVKASVEAQLAHVAAIKKHKRKLKTSNLACWCPNYSQGSGLIDLCHADNIRRALNGMPLPVLLGRELLAIQGGTTKKVRMSARRKGGQL